jgi:hypothetical protein
MALIGLGMTGEKTGSELVARHAELAAVSGKSSTIIDPTSSNGTIAMSLSRRSERGWSGREGVSVGSSHARTCPARLEFRSTANPK